MRMKYVIVKFDHKHAGEVITPILFPDAINHIDMLENMQRSPHRADLVSAGFVDFGADAAGRVKIVCHGESESIGCKSRGEEDAFIIELVQQGWTCSDPEYIEKMRKHREQYPRSEAV